MNATSSINNQRQLDSVAALYLAESGLERAQSILATAGILTNTVCTGIAGSPYALGRGTVTLTATSTPATCNNSGVTPCTNCLVQASGTVGTTTRKVETEINLGADNGVAGTGTNVAMTLQNTYANPSIALFNLATRRQGSDTDSICTSVGGVVCTMKWNIQSQNGGGNPSVGGMGVAVSIPALSSARITQTLDSPRSYAEVGALFPGTSTPSVVGSYWDDSNGGGSKTVGNSTSGGTNNGAACAPSAPVSGACPAPTTPPSPIPNQGSAQASKSWCYGADTLALGFSGRSSALSDNPLTSVKFNTAATANRDIALTRIAHFPNTSITTAPGDVYSDVWYVHNNNYLSPSAAASSGGVVGAIGATVTASIGGVSRATISNGSNVLNVSSQISEVCRLATLLLAWQGVPLFWPEILSLRFPLTFNFKLPRVVPVATLVIINSLSKAAG
jgi:hypothetical protein